MNLEDVPIHQLKCAKQKFIARGIEMTDAEYREFLETMGWWGLRGHSWFCEKTSHPDCITDDCPIEEACYFARNKQFGEAVDALENIINFKEKNY